LTIDTTAGGTNPTGGGPTSGILINDAVDGAGTLTLDAGTGASVSVNHLSGAVGGTTPLTAVTITNAGQATFGRNLTAGTVTITDTTDYVQFAGVVDITTALVTTAEPYDLKSSAAAAAPTRSRERRPSSTPATLSWVTPATTRSRLWAVWSPPHRRPSRSPARSPRRRA